MSGGDDSLTPADRRLKDGFVDDGAFRAAFPKHAAELDYLRVNTMRLLEKVNELCRKSKTPPLELFFPAEVTPQMAPPAWNGLLERERERASGQ